MKQQANITTKKLLYLVFSRTWYLIYYNIYFKARSQTYYVFRVMMLPVSSLTDSEPKIAYMVDSVWPQCSNLL